MVNAIKEIFNRITDIENKLSELIAVGEVEKVYAHNVQVKLLDRDNMITGWLPVLTRKSKNDKFYCMPDIGEQVLCLFVPFSGLRKGFCLGALFNEKDRPVSTGYQAVTFKDGATYIHDQNGGNCSIVNRFVLTSPELSIHADDSMIQGNQLIVDLSQNATIGAQMLSVNAQQITLTMAGTTIVFSGSGGEITGDLNINGNINATGNIIANGANSNHHSHP